MTSVSTHTHTHTHTHICVHAYTDYANRSHMSTHYQVKNQATPYVSKSTYDVHCLLCRLCVWVCIRLQVASCRGRLIHSRRSLIVLFKRCDSPRANILHAQTTHTHAHAHTHTHTHTHTHKHTHIHTQPINTSPCGMLQSGLAFLIKHECSHSCTCTAPVHITHHTHTHKHIGINRYAQSHLESCELQV